MIKKTLLFLLSITISASSFSQSGDNFTAKNEQEILTYIKENKLKTKKTLSGIYYIIEEAGSDKKPTATSKVTVSYKGSFVNGKIFDASSPQGITIGLQQVIKGWTEGIQLFGEGGKGKLIIPSRLGYGNRDRPRIPGGSVLIFDIELIKVN